MIRMMLLAVLFTGSFSLAQTQVAFIEIHDHQGNILQLEPGGRFAHIAISYKGHWLHAHPYRGVELIDSAELEKMGRMTIVSVPNQNEMGSATVMRYLGRPYDPDFSWEDDRFYCSELVGKILGMEPEPMRFQAAVWKNAKLNKSFGLSPDDIFRKLRKN